MAGERGRESTAEFVVFTSFVVDTGDVGHLIEQMRDDLTFLSIELGEHTPRIARECFDIVPSFGILFGFLRCRCLAKCLAEHNSTSEKKAKSE